jgi:hypothetical protein
MVMELADLPGHPARAVARRHKAEIERWYAEVFAKAKAQSPSECARQVALLVEGAAVLILIVERELNLRHRTDLPMDEIARQINPLLRGWIEYYGRYAPSALYPLLRYVNQMLLAWVMRKFKRFKAHKIRASRFLQKLAQENAGLFVHWRLGMTGTFA